MRVCSCFDANNDVFYVRQMFKYTLLLEMDTIYHIFNKRYNKKPYLFFVRKKPIKLELLFRTQYQGFKSHDKH